ncbi:G-X-X-X-Q-X-W domain-containing protein [Lyophyllum atratum]|nr:G-X-X-X-Q-X-W domain-containing protein [Lyophyllum atratum]
MLHLPILALLLAARPLLVRADRQYTIKNSCPAPITLYINGEAQPDFLPPSGGTAHRTFPDTWSGFIYTDANGGNGENGAGTTRAGFYGESNYYYIVLDPNYLNVGVRITPIDHVPSGNFCVEASCTDLSCPQAYPTPPTRFPPPTSTAPPIPLFQCPQPNTGYTVEFCPSGFFPDAPIVTLHPNGNNEKCLDVRGAVYANGTPVQIYDCNGTGAQKWKLRRGYTTVQVAGTTYCLDAGSAPASGVGLKIWTCYDNLPAQAWYYTPDDYGNKLAVAHGDQCVDLTNGVLTNSNRVQTWQCAVNNANQVWNAVN